MNLSISPSQRFASVLPGNVSRHRHSIDAFFHLLSDWAAAVSGREHGDGDGSWK